MSSHLPVWSSFLQVRNVKSITTPIETFKREITTWSPPSDEQDVPVFFMIDTLMDDAFLHWQCESGVFIRYWSEIKETYPNVRILLDKERFYKKLTLQAYGIPRERYLFGSSGSVLPEKNLCIIVPHHIMDEPTIDVPMFEELWSTHILFLRRAAGLADDTPKTINVLALPRQSRENFKHNERVVPETKEMCTWARRLPGGKILSTDTVTDLLDQVRMVASSRVIVTDYGSSSYVNGSLATNSLIIISNRPNPTPYRAGQAIERWILSRGNRIIYVPKFSDAFSRVEAEIRT